jgi:hypothetical protein
MGGVRDFRLFTLSNQQEQDGHAHWRHSDSERSSQKENNAMHIYSSIIAITRIQRQKGIKAQNGINALQ